MDNMKSSDKFLLTLREASVYFGIGEKRLRRLAENHEGGFVLMNGNRVLFIRTRLEEYFIQITENGGKFDGESDTGE